MVDLRFSTSLEGSVLSKDLPEVQHIYFEVLQLMVDLRFSTSPLEGSALSKDLHEVQHNYFEVLQLKVDLRFSTSPL